MYTGLFLAQGFFTLRYAPVAAFPAINLIGKVVAILGLFVIGGYARAKERGRFRRTSSTPDSTQSSGIRCPSG